jgi:hypothetical protein
MADTTDRRAAERMPVGPGTACAFAAPVGEGIGAVRVRDASLAGVGLVTHRKVEVGATLVVTLTNPDRGFAKTVLVKVTHVTPVPGGFLVGGLFDAPLTYQELTTLVM